MPLCELCKSIPEWYAPIKRLKDKLEPSDPRAKYKHHPSYVDLLASASGGCELCDLFVYDVSLFVARAYRSRHVISAWGTIKKDVNAYLKSFSESTQIVLTCFNLGGQFSSYGIFYTIGDSVVTGALPFGSIIPFNNLRRYPEARITQAWKWLGQCEHDHPECVSPDPLYIPSRLVVVGDIAADAVRLVDTTESKDSLVDSRYIALSYCWGLSMPKTGVTTSWNLQKHLKHIELSDLPKTISDAISITRELNIRYIWIDSLCIMQNDATDWQHESGAMSQIYGNAFCTIAAAATDHCNGGIFVEQDRRQLSSVKLKDFSLKASCPDHQDLRNSSALCTRAWAFQERELSPRILWFTKHMLLFECRMIWASEEQPKGNSHPFDTSGVQDRSLNVFQLSGQARVNASPLLYKNASSDVGDMYLTWRSMVAKYSFRELTRGSDKLPALSGLAHEFSKIVDSKYAAGIWVNDIERSLLWRRVLQPTGKDQKRPPAIERNSSIWSLDGSDDSIMPKLRRALSSTLSLVTTLSQETEVVEQPTFKPPPRKHYTAPSWSWASSNGPIDYRTALHSRRQDPAGSASLAAQVIAVTTSPSGSDPFGEVKSGQLRVSGWIRSLRDWMAVPREWFIGEMVRWDEGWDWDMTEGVLILGVLRDDDFEDVPSYHGILIKERDESKTQISETTKQDAVYRRVGMIKSVHANWLGQVQKKEVVLV